MIVRVCVGMRLNLSGDRPVVFPSPDFAHVAVRRYSALMRSGPLWARFYPEGGRGGGRQQELHNCGVSGALPAATAGAGPRKQRVKGGQTWPRRRADAPEPASGQVGNHLASTFPQKRRKRRCRMATWCPEPSLNEAIHTHTQILYPKFRKSCF